MTPYRRNDRGTFVLNLRVRGLGRIFRASGTTDPETFELMRAMFKTLLNKGRLDLLKAVKDGVITPLELYSAYAADGLHQLPSAETIRPLEDGLRDWLAGFEASDGHRLNADGAIRALCRVAPAKVRLVDLPEVLKRYRWQCQKAKTPRAFNLARSTAQAFTRDTFGRHHYLWQAVSAVRLLREKRARGNPQTPTQLRALMGRLPTPYGDMAWAMAVTGMGIKEYWGDWEMLDDRVAIHGTKRGGRERVVPRVGGVYRPTRGYQPFRVALAEASKGAVEPYDMRRSFVTWLESAGIPRTRRRLYMGHGAKDVTDLYEHVQVTAYLEEDAGLLRRFLGKDIVRVAK